MDSPSSPSFMTCALKLDTQLHGWHKSMIKVLSNVQGVSYTIDAQQGIAYVSGRVEPNTLLKMLAKAGKHAELYRIDSGPQPPYGGHGNGSYDSYNYNYYPDYNEYYQQRSIGHYHPDQPQQIYRHQQLQQHYPPNDHSTKKVPAPPGPTVAESSVKSRSNKSSSQCCMM